MGYSIQFDDGSGECDDDLYEIATARGLQGLERWAKSLPKDAVPALLTFLDTGAYHRTDELAEQLKAAFKANPPGDEDTRHVVEGLIRTIGGGAGNEVAVLTND